MVIRCNSNQLRKLVTAVAVTHNTGEPLSAARCIKIDHGEEFNRTTFTSVEPGRAYFSYVLEHTDANTGGTSTSLLLDSADLRKKVNGLREANIDSISIDSLRGVPYLLANLRAESGKRVHDGKVSVQSYRGPVTDFVIPETEDQMVLGIANSNDFTALLKAASFGTFSSDKYEGSLLFSRSIFFTITQNSVQLICNSSQAYTNHIRATINFSGVSDQSHEFGIEGRLISRLSQLEGDVTISVSENWVTFSSLNGQVVAHKAPHPFELARHNQVFSTEFGNYQATRALELTELRTATIIQSLAVESRSDMLLTLEEGRMVVVQSTNLQEPAYCSVDPSYLEGDWQPVVVTGLKQIVDYFIDFVTFHRLDTTTLLIDQRLVERSSGNLWVVHFYIPSCPIEITSFCRDALMELDTND